MALGWLWWRARFPRARVAAAAFCVAGVALGDIQLRFTWQAWYLETSTFVSRGRRGTYGTGLALVARSVPTCPSGRRGCLRGRRGTWRHPSSFHVNTQLVHTQLTHTYSSTRNLLHTNPSPSLFSFLLSPCHLYLSFAACWKKLTCGVIRSFNLKLPGLPQHSQWLEPRMHACPHDICGIWIA